MRTTKIEGPVHPSPWALAQRAIRPHPRQGDLRPVNHRRRSERLLAKAARTTRRRIAKRLKRESIANRIKEG